MIEKLNKIIFIICLIITLCVFQILNAEAELVERIVAIVNDEVILLSEFKAVMLQAEKRGQEVTAEEVIDEMIDKHLLLEQAKKFNLVRDVVVGPFISDEVIENYINKRIKTLIYVPFRDIESYYSINKEKYDGKELYDVKSEIEEYLLNRMLKIKILKHINELRENARIRVQLNN